MESPVPRSNDERVLVLATSSRDRILTCQLLADRGMDSDACTDVTELCREIRKGAGVVITAEEALYSGLGQLLEELGAAPKWSGLPVIVLGSVRNTGETGRRFVAELGTQVNVTLLERPIRPWTLLSAVQAALRARRCQYEVRDFMLERERYAEVLRQAEERLRAAQQAANSGIWEWDLSTGKSTLSEECFRIWGLEPQSGPVAVDWFGLIHPEDRRNARDNFSAAVENNAALQIECRILLPDGEIRWLLTRGRAVARDACGKATRLSGITIDVTSRKQLELEWHQAKEAAEAASRTKSQFLANVSHELRTPMTAILGMTELALEERITPAVRDQLQTIKGAADSLLVLLNDLLDLSRVESGKLSLEHNPFSLREVVGGTIKMLRVRAQEKGLMLGYEVFYQVPDRIIGDPFRLRQVLVNLVGNAVKFTEHGDVSVHVGLHSQANGEAVLEFSVTDTGIGIPRESLDLIFAPFSQVDASTTRKYGGTGLGLALSRNLVDIMGGRMWAESEPGRGSTFRFTARFKIQTDSRIVVEPPPFAMAREAKGRETDSTTPALRILLAEDHPATQKLLEYILTKRGHTVELAANGREAAERIRLQDFDAVIMDVQMPVMDGFQATAAIRALPDPSRAGLPIIAMTANASKGDEHHCLAAGMTAYLSKPFRAPDLLSLLSEISHQRQVPPRAASELQSKKEKNRAASAGRSAEVFDRAEALRRCYGREQFLQDMIDSFLTEAPELLARMQTAIDRKDASELATAAHRLKGTAVYLCAAPTLNAAQQVEQIAGSSDLSSSAAALDRLAKEVLRLQEHLMKQPGAGQ